MLGRILLVGVVVLAFLVLGGFTFLREQGEGLVDRGRERGLVQSGAQISRADFGRVEDGMTKSEIRALVGDAEAGDSSEVEGLELECWYYGVVASTGAYQLCFVNGKLRTKVRFGAAP